MPQPRVYSFRSPRAVIDLHQYLQANGGGYFFTLLDVDNMELPKDDQGNFIAQANTRYNLTVSFSSPKGFLPGTYQYQIPNGLMVDGGSGEFVLSDQTNVGSWIVTDTGLITLMFNENMNSLSEITISATLGIHFPEQSEPIDFDGFITVKVEPPAVQKYPTLLSKWGSPDEDAGKLKWFVRFVGQADSQIPGSILTDQVTLPDWGKPHSYTESDIAAGIVFSVTSADGGWHTWTVTTDDPHLIWNESGWSYKVPKTVTCIYCGELELGNNGWDYMASYTSTPTPLYTPETVSYENKVTIDGQTIFGWNQFTHGQINARVEKNGYFVSDASGGGFLWEFQVDIPGRVEGERAEYAWFIMDEMKLMDKTDTALDRVYNDVNLATVVATYNGNVIQIPRIQDATDQDMFAWDNAWTSEGIASTRTINLLCRCQCTPETCHWGGCEDYWFVRDDGTSATNGFCQCWTETQNMTFTFVYKTTDLSIIRQYGSLGYQLNNLVQLFYMTDGQNSVRVQYDEASITIPNLFEKQLTQDFNGYTAHYMITVNESKASLTNGTPLTIHDTMTDTLAYISGSLVITAENANGEISTLQQGVDFTVTYDGSSGQTDSAGKAVHMLKVVILNPQPVMYILDYDTTLIMPDQVTGGVKYSNSASIELWGQNVSVPSVEKVYADINIAAKDYKLEMLKTCAQTGKPLEGATFGLYNVNGGLIISKDTNASGMIEFKTDVAQGIVLQEHVLYYLQEIKPPPAYLLDDTRYMLCFCSNENAICTECDQILNGTSGIRIRQDETALIEIVNYFVHVELPGTGGTGTRIYMLCGLALMITPFIYAFKRKRKYERRSSG
jgi:LPXTG-motif cell wall-anchored protein